MAKQSYDNYLKARDDDCVSVKMVTEVTKTILQYLKNFTEGLNELHEEIGFLMERVERLEQKMGMKSKGKRKKQKKKSAYTLPAPPSVSYGEVDNEPVSTGSYTSNFGAYREESEDLKSELQSVLAGGIRLKSIEEGKREQLHKMHTAVYEEFKQTSQPVVSGNVYSPPPVDSKKKKKKKKSDDKAVAKLRKALARDLENSFGNTSKR